MLTVKSLEELQRKFLHRDTRRQFGFGKLDHVQVLDYHGKKQWLVLSCCSFDKEHKEYGTYVFFVKEKLDAPSISTILFHYHRTTGVAVVYPTE